MIIIFSAVFTAPAMAAPLTLKMAVNAALQHNRLLVADQYRVEAAESGVHEASGHLLPRIDASYTAMRTDSPLSVFGSRLLQQRITAADMNPATLNDASAVNNYQPRLTISMPLYQGGALWAGKRKAALEAAVARQQHLWFRQQLTFRTIQTYMQTLNAAAQLSAAEKALAASEHHLANVKAMRRRGMLVDSDVMDAEVHRLQSKVAVNQSRNALAHARDVLARLTGIRVHGMAHLAPAPPLSPPAQDEMQLIEQAKAQRPDLQATAAMLASARADIDKSRAAFLPHVSVQASREWNNSSLAVRHSNTTVAAVVNINLLAGGADRAAMNRAGAEAARLSLELADKQQQATIDVRQALRQLHEANMRLAAEQQAMQQATESLRIITLRHAHGLEKTAELLDAQSRADQARAAAIQAKYDVGVATARLLLATGTLSKERIP